MKKTLLPAIILTLGISSSLFAADAKSANKMSEQEKQSYAAGFAQGDQLNKMNKDLRLDLKLDYFMSGFNDAYGNNKSKLDEKETNAVLMKLQQKIMENQKAFLESQFEENKKKSSAFFTNIKNDKKKSVKELSDGILYEVIKASKSTENSPTLEDKVSVSYKGTTIDGKEFDSNEKIELSLKDLIKGWQTALTKMHPGDKWKLYIPSDQAYGERGTRNIMPHSALVFEIELHSVIKS